MNKVMFFPHSDFNVLAHFAQKGPGYRVYIVCNFTGNGSKEVGRYSFDPRSHVL